MKTIGMTTRSTTTLLVALALSTLVLPIEFANAEEQMACSMRSIDSKSIWNKMILNCPGDGRVGRSVDMIEKASGLDVKVVSANGRIQDLKWSRAQALKILGDVSEGGRRYLATHSISEQMGPDGSIKLSPELIRELGLDPNVVGSTKVFVTGLTLPKSIVLTDDSGEIARVRNSTVGAATPQCAYVGKMRVLKNIAAGANCSARPSLCSASVECLEPNIGWVTRSAVCESKDGTTCPTSAETCVSDQAIASLTAAEIPNVLQPHQRPSGRKPEAKKVSR